MTQPPHRMPCEAVAGKPLYFLGGPFQHHLSPALADTFLNTTTVPNPNAIVGGVVGPYERFTQDLSGAESCETHNCNPDAAPCSAWLRPFPENTFAHTSGDSVNFAVARKSGFKAVQARRYWNGRFGYFNQESTNGPDNVQGCGDDTQTRWRGYTSAVDNTKFLTLDIDASWTQTLFHSDDWPSPPSTTVLNETFAVMQHIDANSGLLTFSALALSPNTERNHALALYTPALWKWSDIIARMTVEISATPDGGSKICAGNAITISDSNGNVIESVTWDIGAGAFERRVYFYDHLHAQFVLTDESVTVTNTQINYSRTDTEYFNYDLHHDTFYPAGTTVLEITGTLGGAHTSASVYADIKSLLGHWNLADDAQYPWRADLKVSAAPLVSRDELFTTDFTETFWARDYGNPISNASGSFGDPGWDGECGILLAPDPATGGAIVVQDLPVESGDVFAGVPGALNPFSHCLPTAFAIVGGSLPPGIALDPTTGVISGAATASGHFGVTIQVTGAAPAATGAILGAPLPAGYRNFFDFGYRDILGCCFMPPENPGFQTWSWYQHGWGMDAGTFNANSGCQLPLNATQWTNYFQSVNKPQGAWLFYNDTSQNYFGANYVSSEGGSGAGDADALWACKYAECLEHWPSQNFARPAGDDKFALDENHVLCATPISGTGAGSTWAITDPISGFAPGDGTDFNGLWGGAVVDGFFNVANYSSGTLTLGAKIFDVPGDWTSRSNRDEGFCFGKLRFANCPALLGRVAITTDLPGATFTFATAQPSFGLNAATHQEQIDLFDKDMTLLASDVTATRVDDLHFTITTVQPDARFVTLHGVAKWYLNDTSPKGDYALLQWLADFRSFGEYNRLASAVDCSSTPIAQPSTNAGGGPIANQFAAFTQTPGCLPFVPCAPKVVCISPNGEHFPNGVTYDFPATFACDEHYGSKWWAWVQSTMTDLLWQTPHRPCNLKPCAKWQMDGGVCAENSEGSCPGDDDFIPGESEPPEYFFAHAPQVEARLSLPCDYGAAQNECAPILPADIQIGWLSPVIYSEGDIALPPLPPGALSDRGEPAGAATAWDLHALLCGHAAGCRFNYQLPGC